METITQKLGSVAVSRVMTAYCMTCEKWNEKKKIQYEVNGCNPASCEKIKKFGELISKTKTEI